MVNYRHQLQKIYGCDFLPILHCLAIAATIRSVSDTQKRRRRKFVVDEFH
jgi:hypothetical protein